MKLRCKVGLPRDGKTAVMIRVVGRTEEDETMLALYGVPALDLLADGKPASTERVLLGRADLGVAFFASPEKAKAHVERITSDFVESVKELRRRWGSEGFPGTTVEVEA